MTQEVPVGIADTTITTTTIPRAPLDTDIPPDDTTVDACTLRPLSCTGRLIRSTPMKNVTHPMPDLAHVRARYLDPPEDPSSRASCSPNKRAAHARYEEWKLGKMHHDVPDYRRSQPRMSPTTHCLRVTQSADVVTLKQVQLPHSRAWLPSLTPVCL
jgi:hypothetical protein